MADRSIRASDGERERVVEILRDQTGEGRLTLDEFEERMSAAYAAKTWDDLQPLTRDLPVGFGEGDHTGLREEHQPEQPRQGSPGHPLHRMGPGMLVGPAVIALLVTLVLAYGWSPLVFFGLFWVFCAGGKRGCRSRRLNAHQAGH